MLRLSWKVANPRLVCKENANYPLNVEKELEMLAEVMIDGSQFSGTKSVEVETPALKAAADDEWFELVTLEECTALYAGVFPHFAKLLDLELTKYPKKTVTVQKLESLQAGPPVILMKRTAKHIFVWVTKETAESNSKQRGDPESPFYAFLLPCRPDQPFLVT